MGKLISTRLCLLTSHKEHIILDIVITNLNYYYKLLIDYQEGG